MDSQPPYGPAEVRQAQFAIRLSLFFGLIMLVGKSAAYVMTGSAAILSDAAESVIHVVAVTFAAFSMWLSLRPAKNTFLYGYERIAFFSAGFEGAMIVLAAIAIFAAAVDKWLRGLQFDNLGWGTLIVLAASVLNAALGFYLLRVGRKTKSLILEANGKHVLTDSWTSFGVVAGLGLVIWTGWKPFDPLCAIAVALNILWSGGHLIARSIRGLLDYSDPVVGKQIRERLDKLCADAGVQYHGLRFRSTGQRLIVEVHLLFPFSVPLGDAHRTATLLEDKLKESIDPQAEVVTHLESLEDHSEIHGRPHYTGKPA
ncbi:MAG: cation diffusion facilitator family transporter [Bryobacteraceae bacterium]